MNTRISDWAYWRAVDPMWKIMIVALLARLVAVVFSAGYGMHDDHFLIIEASASWVDGYDYNHWLPWNPGNRGEPEGHSFTYVGLNFLYFYVMKFLGVVHPKVLMFGNRLLHALASLIVVWYGMKITERLGNRKQAILVGWILALLWILVFASVRNLVEVAALPFLVFGTWQLMKNELWSNWLLGGILIGIAVSFRYQIGVFGVGIGLYFLFTKQFRALLFFALGSLLVFVVTQGLVDYLIWGYPFAEAISYISYNLTEGTTYLPNQNYFMYLLVLTASLFIPLGIIIAFGFFKSARKHLFLFVPTCLFLLFHTFYPNRQERFILSILPFFIILGVLGFHLLKESQRMQKFWRFSWIFFLVLNFIFLAFASTMYSKKSRVEAMYSLYGKTAHDDYILLEGSGSGKVSMMPLFYAKAWHMRFGERLDPNAPLKDHLTDSYDYIFFFDEAKLNERIAECKTVYPNMRLIKKCYPSLIDRMLRTLNPRNANEYIEVWETR
jgi:hypothetical protein